MSQNTEHGSKWFSNVNNSCICIRAACWHSAVWRLMVTGLFLRKRDVLNCNGSASHSALLFFLMLRGSINGFDHWSNLTCWMECFKNHVSCLSLKEKTVFERESSLKKTWELMRRICHIQYEPIRRCYYLGSQFVEEASDWCEGRLLTCVSAPWRGAAWR